MPWRPYSVLSHCWSLLLASFSLLLRQCHM